MSAERNHLPVSSGRRRFLKTSAAAGGMLMLPVSVSGAFADNPAETRLHGLSAFGELKYASDFKHFDYINPKAPKGGRFHFQPGNWYFNENVLTFNTLNCFVLKGDAPPRMEMCFDTLMVSALDEPDAIYCHLAEWVQVSKDRNSYSFGLRKGAAFHDGTPVKASDVVFSLLQLKEKGHPQLAFPLAELVSAKVLDERTVQIRYSGNQSAHAILAVSSFPILSRDFYTQHPFDSSSLDVPLSSGPYKPGRLEAGRFIEFDRVAGYWGKDLPTSIGTNNFDRIRIDFFAAREAAFEAFKKGSIHWREEFVSKTWASEYTFPALAGGKVIKAEFPEERRPAMQAWALNQRRKQFKDQRVRQAINLCFDFEWTNAKIFYNAYKRAQSLFEKSDFVATGTPEGAELALLKSLKSEVPEAALGPAAMQPKSDGSGNDRSLLKKAYDLLGEAGWKREGELLEKDGEKLTVEILIRSQVMERLLSGMIRNMRNLGINATMRLVDPAQYQSRTTSFDFDMTMLASQFEATPTAETLRQFISSEAARREGSYNLSGVSAPVYDELIGHIRTVKSRDDLVTAMRALDRIERARLDWIPGWYAANHRVAYWDMFGFVKPKPDYGWPVESQWWYDADKARAIGKA